MSRSQTKCVHPSEQRTTVLKLLLYGSETALIISVVMIATAMIVTVMIVTEMIATARTVTVMTVIAETTGTEMTVTETTGTVTLRAVDARTPRPRALVAMSVHARRRGNMMIEGVDARTEQPQTTKSAGTTGSVNRGTTVTAARRGQAGHRMEMVTGRVKERVGRGLQ